MGLFYREAGAVSPLKPSPKPTPEQIPSLLRCLAKKKCRLPTEKSRLPTEKSRLPTEKSKLLIFAADYRTSGLFLYSHVIAYKAVARKSPKVL
jgi:hypothetical protein